MKIPRKTTRLLSVCFMITPIMLNGQTTDYLSMDQAVALSEQHSSIVQKADLDYQIARSNRQQTNAIFLPQVSLGYNALFTNDPLNAFGFLLQQQQVQSSDFDPAKLNHPGNTHDYVASVDFQMPLINVDKIFARKGAKLQEDVYRHQAASARDHVRFEVKKAYTQLQFAYQARLILAATLNDVKGIYESVTNFYKQGLLQKSDVLNAQVQVNTIEVALSKAESTIKDASDGLRVLLGEDLSIGAQAYQTDSLKPELRRPTYQEFSMMRSDILAMKKAVEASKMQKKSLGMAFVPSINAFGNYQFHDDQFFRFNQDAYMVGIMFKWTIFSGNLNRGKYRSASFQHDKMQKEYELYVNKSRIEVEKNKRALVDLNLEIRKQETSVNQAYEALRIMTDRHQEGLVSTTDLLLAQAQHSQKQLALAQSIMNYNIACYYQEILTNSL